MPRRLPWQKEQGSFSSATAVRAPKRLRSPLAKNGDRGRDENENDIEGSTAIFGRGKARTSEREPSSSPPPPPAGPPPQTFMKEGLAGDDRWIMVEDEFMVTARDFTRHIHQAEYNRLKHLAKKRNAPAISSITRPTNGPRLSKVAEIRQRSDIIARKQRYVLGTFASDEDSDEGPWSQNPHLAGLMGQPHTFTSRLSQLAAPSSNTRAALGYSQSQSQDGAAAYQKAPSERADEAIGNMSLPRPSSHATPIQAMSTVPSAFITRTGSGGGGVQRARAPILSNFEEKQSEAISPVKASSSVAVANQPEDVTSKFSSSSFAERMAKRRADKIKSKKREEKSVSLDQVPTFLF